MGWGTEAVQQAQVGALVGEMRFADRSPAVYQAEPFADARRHLILPGRQHG